MRRPAISAARALLAPEDGDRVAGEREAMRPERLLSRPAMDGSVAVELAAMAGALEAAILRNPGDRATEMGAGFLDHLQILDRERAGCILLPHEDPDHHAS